MSLLLLFNMPLELPDPPPPPVSTGFSGAVTALTDGQHGVRARVGDLAGGTRTLGQVPGGGSRRTIT